MRTPKKAPSLTDFSKLVDPSALTIVQDDCWGQLYNPLSSDCRGCADQTTCLIAQTHHVTEKAKASMPTFVDQIDMSAIPVSNLVAAIKEGGYTLAELQEAIKHYSKCPDDRTVEIAAQNICLVNEITIKEDGQLCC